MLSKAIECPFQKDIERPSVTLKVLRKHFVSSENFNLKNVHLTISQNATLVGTLVLNKKTES